MKEIFIQTDPDEIFTTTWHLTYAITEVVFEVQNYSSRIGTSIFMFLGSIGMKVTVFGDSYFWIFICFCFYQTNEIKFINSD